MSSKTNIGRGYFRGIDTKTLGKVNPDREMLLTTVEYALVTLLLLILLLLSKRGARHFSNGKLPEFAAYFVGIAVIASGMVFYLDLNNNISGYFSITGN